MEKAGLFPGEGAPFQLQINLPAAVHILPLLLTLVALAQPGLSALFSTSHHPAPCVGVPGLERDSSRAGGHISPSAGAS